jgi:hypothetical protein
VQRVNPTLGRLDSHRGSESYRSLRPADGTFSVVACAASV